MGYRSQQEGMMPFLLHYRMMECVEADVHGSVHGCGVGESGASGELAIQWLLRVDCLWRVRINVVHVGVMNTVAIVWNMCSRVELHHGHHALMW